MPGRLTLTPAVEHRSRGSNITLSVRIIRLLAVCLGLCGVVRAEQLAAAVVAADVASNSAYGPETGGAWKGLLPTAQENPAGTDDGGVGFNAWNFAGGYHNSLSSPYGRLNHFIDGVDFAASSFNSLGAPSFGLTNANTAGAGAFTVVAARAFESPLTVGSSFSFNFDNPALTPLSKNDEAGFVIRLNSGGGPVGQAGVVERFAMYAVSNYLGGGWIAADAAGDNTLNLGSTQTTSGAQFRFTLTAAQTYRLDLLPLTGGAALATRLGGLKSPASGAINAIEVLMYGNGSGNGLTGAAGQPTGAREFFFNNLSIATPNPAGDYDGDGDADGNDFLRWQATLGSTTNLAADGSGNGVVDSPDLHIWKSAAVATAAATAAVPEPFLSALIAPLWVLTASRRRSR